MNSLSSSEKKNEIDSFKKITCQSEMVSFLSKSVSIYHRLCHFFYQYPIKDFIIDKTQNHEFQVHHIICLYLNQNYNTFFSNIEENYNKVEVPYLIHIQLHLVRLFEFQYNQDAITVLAASEGINDTIDNLSVGIT